ncbi:MAG: four helix bundle protein [Pseudomonadota bacterium]
MTVTVTVAVAVAVAVAAAVAERVPFINSRRGGPMSDSIPALCHETLHVDQAGIEFLSLTEGVFGTLPRGIAALVDPLRRAALSICLNIAEGYGKQHPADRARFYDFARGSAHECGAVFDVLGVKKLLAEGQLRQGKILLHRIVSMLVRMVNP